MPKFLLYIHPVMQIIATLAGLYALVLGFKRFQALHLGSKAAFQRQRHITMGLTAMVLWLAGIIGGIIMGRLYWHAFLVTGEHALMGLIMLPLILFGGISGYYMKQKPAKRKVLPLLHGLVNFILVVLAFFQWSEGFEVLNTMV